MKRKEYRDFLQHVLYDMKLRRILMTDIYNTKYYLNTEYLVLFAKGNARLYYLHLPFALDSELDFYLHLDMLTYLPFEKLGYEYLNNELLKENSNVIEFKYNKIMEILDDAKFNIEQDIFVEATITRNNKTKETISATSFETNDEYEPENYEFENRTYVLPPLFCPCFYYMKKYPTSRLKTSGLAVGLPEGQMGNSEVGHLTIGAGRIVEQDLLHIDNEIKRGDFFNNPALLKALEYAEENGKEEKLTLPKSFVLKYIFDDGGWFVLRPSGTEPKYKIY